MRATRIVLGLALAVFVAGIVAPPGLAQASPVPISELWQEFQFAGTGSFGTACLSCAPSSGGNSEFVGDPPWTFTLTTQGALFVTDAFLIGDRFEVFDFGVSLGLTSPPGTGGDCGSDPAVCIVTAGVSQAEFPLGVGDHSITIEVEGTPFSGGAAYFRPVAIIEAPAPAALLLLATGLLGGFAITRLRARS